MNNIKFLESIENDKYSLDVIECGCGFHIGLDSTYLEQVGKIDFRCPRCKEMIGIAGYDDDDSVPFNEFRLKTE